MGAPPEMPSVSGAALGPAPVDIWKRSQGTKGTFRCVNQGFEGGQMPIHRRLPKRGFNNIFRKDFVEVNLGKLQAAIDAGKLDAGKPVDMAALLGAGVISKPRDGVRILGKGQLTAKKLEIHAAGASKSAVAAVEKAGGKIVLPAAATE